MTKISLNQMSLTRFVITLPLCRSSDMVVMRKGWLFPRRVCPLQGNCHHRRECVQANHTTSAGQHGQSGSMPGACDSRVGGTSYPRHTGLKVYDTAHSNDSRRCPSNAETSSSYFYRTPVWPPSQQRPASLTEHGLAVFSCKQPQDACTTVSCSEWDGITIFSH